MDLTWKDAETKALALKAGDLEPCPNPPTGIYGIDSTEYFFFAVINTRRIGATEYIGVSKETGIARHMGFNGE